jgi:dihydroorotate dehydrogenase
MSGAPVHKKNLELVRYIHTRTEGKLPIIGVGGIMSGEDAQEMIDAGASLVEIYSGFIYEGPALVKKIIKHLENHVK